MSQKGNVVETKWFRYDRDESVDSWLVTAFASGEKW